MKAEQARDLAIMKGELDLLKHRETLRFEREKAGLAPAASEPFHAGALYDASA